MGPPLLILTLAAAPAGILWWLAHGLFGVALIGTVLFEAGEGDNALLAHRLPRVWAAAIGAEAVLILAMPEQVLSLWDVPERVYPWAQTLAAGALVVCIAALTKVVRADLLPASREGSPTEALQRRGVIPAGGSGRPGARRRGRRAKLEPDRVFIRRLRDTVALRAALASRWVALGALTLAAGLIFGVVSGWAFFEAWLALLLVWVLLLETRLVRWQRESLADGFVEHAPGEGRLAYDLWWGLGVGWVLVVTASATVRMAGIRPQPWFGYLLLIVLAVLAAAVPWRRVRSKPDAVLVAWLRRNPQRAAELQQVRAAWSGDPADFGPWPDIDGYADPLTGERLRGR